MNHAGIFVVNSWTIGPEAVWVGEFPPSLAPCELVAVAVVVDAPTGKAWADWEHGANIALFVDGAERPVALGPPRLWPWRWRARKGVWKGPYAAPEPDFRHLNPLHTPVYVNKSLEIRITSTHPVVPAFGEVFPSVRLAFGLTGMT